MTRPHGNNKGKRSKITVALKILTLGGQLEYFKLTLERVNIKNTDSILGFFPFKTMHDPVRIHRLKHTLAELSLSVLDIAIFNKPYYRCVVRFEMNHGACPKCSYRWHICSIYANTDISATGSYRPIKSADQ